MNIESLKGITTLKCDDAMDLQVSLEVCVLLMADEEDVPVIPEARKAHVLMMCVAVHHTRRASMPPNGGRCRVIAHASCRATPWCLRHCATT